MSEHTPHESPEPQATDAEKPESRTGEWDGTDDHGHPVKVGSLVVADGESLIRVTQILPGVIIGRELDWHRPLEDRYTAVFFDEAKRDLTVIEDPPETVASERRIPALASASLDLMLRLELIVDEVRRARQKIDPKDERRNHERMMLENIVDGIQQASGELINFFHPYITTGDEKPLGFAQAVAEQFPPQTPAETATKE